MILAWFSVKGAHMVAELADTMTISEAARYSAMTPNGLRYWIERGEVETIRTPLGRVVVRESFESFLRNRAQEADTAIASR